MRRVALLGCAVLLVGCAKREAAPAADTMAAAPVAPAMLSLADVAGKWTVRVMPETSDSTVVQYELMAANTTEGWTITLPNRAPMAVRVTVGGDSLVMESGPYESVLRKGVQVTTHGVARLQGGKLVGMTVAHYATNKPDSVARFRVEGTRAP